MANQQIFVLGDDGNLWLETGPFGTVPLPSCPQPQLLPPASCRVQVDGNVSNIFSQVGENRVWRTPFQALDQNTIFVLGSDDNLWLEYGPFGVSVPPNRNQVDGSVDTFQALDSNTVLVQGTDGNLWLEFAPFGVSVPPSRTQVDGSVNAFQALDLNTIFVLGDDGNLWLEYGSFGTVPLPSCNGSTSSCRNQVDGNVLQFYAPNPTPGEVFVLGTDLNLWFEPGPFGNLNITQSNRSQVDGNVNDFQPVSFLNGSSAILVLGHDGNLWLEYPPYSLDHTIQTRKFVDGNVMTFGAIPTAASPEDLEIFVIDGNNNLWDEHWPFGPGNRTQVDGNVNSCQPLYSQPSLFGSEIKKRQPPTRVPRLLRPSTRL